MNQSFIYIISIIALVTLSIIGILIKRKFNIKNQEIKFIKLIFETVNFITKQFDFKYKDDITTIVEYSFEALNFINTYETIEDIKLKKELVKDKALTICEKENINLEDNIIEIIDNIIDHILDINK